LVNPRLDVGVQAISVKQRTKKKKRIPCVASMTFRIETTPPAYGQLFHRLAVIRHIIFS
jgi:hypothetical protein